MKKVTIILTGVILMSIASLTANAQNTATVTDAQASATIITKITLAKVTDMSFGEIVANTVSTDVSLGLTNNLSIESGTGKATLFPGTSGTTATFSTTGEAGRNYAITLPANNTITLAGPTGSTPMQVNNFMTSTLTGNAINTSGEGDFSVGAVLTVGANQLAGDYSGNYAVTVTYE